MNDRDLQRMEEATTILIGNLQHIHTVRDWAERLGYNSVTKFTRQFKHYSGLTPGRVIRYIRLVCIMELIAYDPDLTGYEIALKVGLADEKALYDFLTNHNNSTLSQLKKTITSTEKWDFNRVKYRSKRSGNPCKQLISAYLERSYCEILTC
ncbi:MAG TPA: helix-turn-helix domain-containing protein [Balneolales bacterium]|nr:helix-turn-helix domain-containing protein [Balneolales bacterium]